MTGKQRLKSGFPGATSTNLKNGELNSSSPGLKGRSTVGVDHPAGEDLRVVRRFLAFPIVYDDGGRDNETRNDYLRDRDYGVGLVTCDCRIFTAIKNVV